MKIPFVKCLPGSCQVILDNRQFEYFAQGIDHDKGEDPSVCEPLSE
jgi:hypothetical protein